MWWKLSFETGLLALEAQRVFLLRVARLAQGGAAAEFGWRNTLGHGGNRYPRS